MPIRSIQFLKRSQGAGFILGMCLCPVLGAWAQTDMAPGQASSDAPAPMHHHAQPEAGDCAGTDLKCATAVTPAFDAHNNLWIAWVAGGAVSVARSTDLGRTFTDATIIGRYGDLIDVGADAKPQLAIDAQGRAVVAYGVFKDKAYDAQVWIARSASIWAKDGPRFGVPRSLSSDPASQRFPVLAFTSNGRLFAAWLDKRTVELARKQGRAQAGAALAYAWSDDAGATFSGEAIAQDDTCECCRLALAFDARRQPVMVFRAIYDEHERDPAVLVLSSNGKPALQRRVAEDHWVIDGCPHHGPSVAVTADGALHAAWFTQGNARQGLFYARSENHGQNFSDPMPIGIAARQPGRPSLLASGNNLWLAWKEFDGTHIYIKERHSSDAGRHWTNERKVAETDHAADHPVLIAHDGAVFLSWSTRDQGYRLIRLEAT
jgi:hypothetical protein